MDGLFNAIDMGAVDSSGIASWRPDEKPDVSSIDLTVESESWSVELGNLSVECVDQPCLAAMLKGHSPRVVSIPIGRGPRPRVQSFTFSCPVDDSFQGDSLVQDESQSATTKPTIFSGPKTSTRIQPPRDVVKLKDRLDYILQPSLESLMVERSLKFPFEPFPYQFAGVAFLYPRHAAILADEMGLGKTMQTITAVRLLLHRGELRRILLVCPKPLVTNWLREFALWAPEIPVAVIEGNQEQRRWRWQLPDAPVKIANYELLNRDLEFFADGPYDGESNDDKPVFDLVVLDESQRIKNRRSATSQAARSIKSRRRWALTGTPVENSTEDLVGIFEFLSPGFLSPDLRPRKMGQTVRDYVLRRTKDSGLIDLPPKMFRDAELDLSPEQQAAYQRAEDEGVVQLNSLGDQLSIQHVFELVLRLKQICNFDPASGMSSKFERLEADLEEVAQSGRKAIVFSQWVGTLKTLSERLGRFGVLEYHGGIPSRQRDVKIKQFREDPDSHVMLLSYGAGSVGLNLQFASYVFLYDRWWNPAVEDQAINRVHRIGSTGPVTVSRFMMLDTIEERISRILEEKRELFDTIFSGSGSQRKMGLTQDEVFGLFDLKSPKGPIRAAA
ncbi:MAG: DEAD/DEAH box helicase [Pirellulales bacterium]|nr:DEAD/DEAH box helicase [Pirellulales bacterium]